MAMAEPVCITSDAGTTAAERTASAGANSTGVVGSPAETVVDASESVSLVADVGDLVILRYNDDPSRTVRVRLSGSEHKPEVEVIHMSEPLAQAVMGRAMEEEIEASAGRRAKALSS